MHLQASPLLKSVYLMSTGKIQGQQALLLYIHINWHSESKLFIHPGDIYDPFGQGPAPMRMNE